MATVASGSVMCNPYGSCARQQQAVELRINFYVKQITDNSFQLQNDHNQIQCKKSVYDNTLIKSLNFPVIRIGLDCAVFYVPANTV